MCIRPLLGLSLLLTVMAAVLAAGSIALGLRQPDPEAAYWAQFGFERCAMPCYADLTPGQTPFDEAVDRVNAAIPALTQRLLVSTSQAVFFGEDEALSETLSGVAHYYRGVVGQVRLTLYRPLSSVLLRYGRPDCAALYPPHEPTVVYLYWQAEPLLYWASFSVSDAVRLNSPVFTISTTALEPAAVCQTSPEVTAWRGFVPIWRMVSDRAASG